MRFRYFSYIRREFITGDGQARCYPGDEKLKSRVPATICSIVKTKMKKKPIAEPVISPEILAMAKKSVEAERPPALKRCAVCGAGCTPVSNPQTPSEDLCWICRRLKISAWREADQQVSAQE